MLNDVHLKVLYYEPDSSKVFSNTDIKGGVAITYRDGNAEFGAIGSFTPYNELNDILHRVKNHKSFVSIEKIVITSLRIITQISCMRIIQMQLQDLVKVMRMI